MKKVFVDTNVILDYYLNREGADDAEKIFTAAYNGEIALFASILTFANFAYVAKRGHTQEDVYMALDEFEKRITALPMDKRQLRSAIDNHCKDFEDMLQYQCAIAAGCDVLVTNNTKDFREFCQLPLMTSREFLTQIIDEQ